MPRLASGIRVMVLTPCPMMNMACTLSGCVTWSFGSNVASNQRVLGIPGASISALLVKREIIQS